METRIGIGTDGKKYEFQTEGEYYPPNSDANELFKPDFTKFACCVLYTKLRRDDGYKDGMRWGSPSWEYYDNGVVGYQNGQFYETIEEGKQHLENYSQLSPKIGTIAYVDVWLAINDNKK